MSIIKSFSVGDGDMFYIDHNSDNFSIIDCCMDDGNKEAITQEIKDKISKKGIIRFISTHPDEDHLQGLKYLDEQIGIVNFYCVENSAVKTDETEDFKHYCTLRDGEHAYYISKGCSRKWMNIGDETRGCAGINFKWPITTDENFKESLSAVTEVKDLIIFLRFLPTLLKIMLLLCGWAIWSKPFLIRLKTKCRGQRSIFYLLHIMAEPQGKYQMMFWKN